MLFGLQELPLAVFKKPHCFCTWTPSLFSLNQQSDNQQCVEQTGLNHTGNSTAVAPTELAHYQVYHTPVLGEITIICMWKALKVITATAWINNLGTESFLYKSVFNTLNTVHFFCFS